MIYLIGGSSHVGKTLLAQKLLEKTNIPYLSLDHLKMSFIKTKLVPLDVKDDDDMRYWLWPFIKEIIKTVINNNQNLIIEGCYIPIEWQKSFNDDELEKIKCLFIVMSKNYIENNFKNIKDYAEVIEKRENDILDMNRLIKCSEYFKEGCIKYHIPFYEIDNEFNIDNLLNKIIS